MNELDVLLQGAPALQLGLAALLRTLHQLPSWAAFLRLGYLPLRVGVLTLHHPHLHLLLLFAVLALVDVEADHGEEDLSTWLT